MECQSDGPNETCINEKVQTPLRTICIASFGREGHMANKCRSMSLLLPRILAHTLMIA